MIMPELHRAELGWAGAIANRRPQPLHVAAEYALGPLAIGLIVASSGLLVVLAILGSAVIAANRRGAKTLAWLAALSATTAVLLLDEGPTGTGVGTALVAGSAVGAACAIATLFFGRARS